MKVPEIQGIGKHKLGRIFGACMFSLTVILALGTIALAAGNNWENEGSYSLVIQKLFDASTPDDVLKEAEEQTYSFRIKGYRIGDRDTKIPIDEVVEINKNNGWKTKPFYSSGPIHVTVTEITNNVTLHVNGKAYNMGNSRVETSTEFTDSVQQRSLNSNGQIVISRPEKKLDGNGNDVAVTTTSTFLITSEWDGEESEKPDGWKPYHNTVTLAPGREAITLSGLSAGRYTIQDLSVSGYRIQLGERSEDVAAGKAGEFYINSKPGNLVITAGGKADDGKDHYFTIDRLSAPSGAEPFTQRTTEPVRSRETYALENLPRGHYKVTEYTVSDVPSEFTVKVPQTTVTPITYKFEKKHFGGTYTKFPAGGDWITDLKFGPLRNASNNILKPEYTYDFGIRYRKTAEQEGYTTTTWKTPKKANTRYSFTSPIYPRADNTLAFAVWNVTATTGDHIDLSWTENTRTIVDYKESGLNANHTFTVDDRGWMEITAPTVSDIIAEEEITYTYSIRNDSGTVETLTLEPGKTKRIEGLEAGSYLVTETAKVDEPQGFSMKIFGNPYGSTEAGTSFDITTMDERSLNIIKEKGSDEGIGDGGRTYTFTVEKYKGDFTSEIDPNFQKQTVRLKAGESSKDTNQLIELPAGNYRVTPTDDKTEIYKLQCSDTSQVRAEVPSIHSATVTFTNVFTEGNLGYRYVHEYYYRDSSGKYVYEGNSPITTVGGRTNPNETYTSIDINKKPYYIFTDKDGVQQSYSYDYLSSAYGYVTANSAGDTVDSDGLRTSNRYTETAGEVNKTTFYQVDSTLTQNRRIRVTPNNDQIIILRYFRVLPEDQKGSYNYVHIYYYRDEKGDHWEGTSEITPVTGQLGLRYTTETISLRPDYQPEGADMPYHYTYNNRPSCGVLSLDHNDPPIELNRVSDPQEDTHRHYKPNSDAGYVIATEAGDQIIILRYYREVLPEDRYGSYKIVHEYYFREDVEGTDNKNDDGQDVQGDPDLPEEEDKTVPEEGDKAVLPEKEDQDAAQEGENNGPVPEDDDDVKEPASEGGEAPAPEEDQDKAPAPEDDTGEGSAPEGAEDTGAAPEDAGEIAPLSDASEIPDPAGEGPSPEDGETGPVPEAEDTEEAAPSEDASEVPTEEKEGPAPEEKEEPSQDDMDGTVNDGTGGQGNDGDETEGTVNGTAFSGTLSSDNEHIYKFEGAREIVSIRDKLSTAHKGEEVALRPNWIPINGSDSTTSYVYNYIDAVCGLTKDDNTYEVIDGKTWVESTESGDQIIILRYFRVEGGAEAPPSGDDEPDPPQPDNPSPGPSPGPSPSHKPDPKPDPGPEPEQPTDPENPDGPDDPTPPETPSGPDDPQTPADPGYPTELPDPSNPGSPNRVTIWENGIPTTYVKLWDPEKEKWVYIPETKIPTTNKDIPTTTIISRPSRVPKTGDAGSLWSVLAAAALSGLGALRLPFWKKKD